MNQLWPRVYKKKRGQKRKEERKNKNIEDLMGYDMIKLLPETFWH